jgi:hypothetical protein
MIKRLKQNCGDILHNKNINNFAKPAIPVSRQVRQCQNPWYAYQAHQQGEISTMKIIISVLLLLLLNACAKPLQPENYAERISATRLDQDAFLVAYRGSAVAGSDKIVDLTLLRSAETALENGFNYFVIVKTNESVSTGAYTAPDSSVGQVDNYLQDGGYEPTVVGDKTYLHADPGAVNTIVCFREKPLGFSYIALFLKASLRDKYQLNRLPQ